MVENLNRLTFSRFGKVLRDTLPHRGFPQGEEWTESVQHFKASDAHFLELTGGDLYLDFETGMTVLALRQDEQVTCFYLDKPVRLSAGTVFSIVPYQQECAVRMCLPKTAQLLEREPVTALENLKISDKLALGEIYTLFYRETESGFLFKGEEHSMLELTYVDQGALHCVVDGSSYTLRQGQLMIFGAHQWHMQYTDLDASVRFLTIAFDLNSRVAENLPGHVFDLSSEEAAFLRQILHECDMTDGYSGDFIRGYLKLLLLSILRDVGGVKKRLQTPAALNNENAIVSRALQYIADHVYEKLPVEAVAKGIGVSASHLTALFHRQMGISPGEYIRRVKLEESKGLIREGKMNFSQIAAALHYSTIHHFSRQFKEKFGVSPSEYAKSLQAGND